MDKCKFVLYLDLDGVLTSSNYIVMVHKSFVKKNDKKFHYRNFMHQYCFQEEGVQYLNELYDLAPYCIVLTSTRRFQFDKNEWTFLFSLNGIKAEVVGRTDSFSFKPDRFTWREDEIYKYHYHSSPFGKNDTPFIIIDDDNFDLMTYTDKLIHVNTETGLTMEYLEETKQKLKNQNVELKENIEDGK